MEQSENGTYYWEVSRDYRAKNGPQCEKYTCNEETESAGATTYRFGDKTNRSRPVELAVNYIINSSSSVTYLKSTSLNASNSSWADNNLQHQQ